MNINKKQKKKISKLRLFAYIILILTGVVILVAGAFYAYIYYALGQALNPKTDNPINSKILLYKIALNEAISEVSIETPLFQQTDTNGCTKEVFEGGGGETCSINALLYYSDNGEQPLFEKHLRETGWQDQTIRNTMIPDEQDPFFKVIDGLPVCLYISKENKDEENKNITVNIEMAYCPNKNPDPAEAWSGWQIYFPSDIPSRYIIKNSSKDLLDGEITLTYSQIPLKGNFEPYIDIEESKLPSTYNPPSACNFDLYDNLHPCPLYLTTPSGYKIYQDSSYNDKSENVFYTAINHTRIVITKWYEPENNPVLTDTELENVVDSFTPISLSDFEKKIPQK